MKPLLLTYGTVVSYKTLSDTLSPKPDHNEPVHSTTSEVDSSEFPTSGCSSDCIEEFLHSDVSSPLSESDNDIMLPRSDPPCPLGDNRVYECLSPSLKAPARSGLRYVDESHKCFKLPSVLAFREKYNIDENPWNHFVRLLCGCADLPIIILQNPSNNHSDEYNKTKLCPTLTWISETLKGSEIGLDIEDVIILDICSLLSDRDLDRMDRDKDTTWAAVEESYAIAEDILKELIPTVALCCQCRTLNGWIPWLHYPGRTELWKPAKNSLARELCSSPSQAERGHTTQLTIKSSGEDHTILMVCGVHPMRAAYDETGRMESVLKAAFECVYGPCKTHYHDYRRERVVKQTTADVTEGIDTIENLDASADALADDMDNLKISGRLDKPANLQPETVSDLLSKGLSKSGREITLAKVEMKVGNSASAHILAKSTALDEVLPVFRRGSTKTGSTSQLKPSASRPAVSVFLGGFADDSAEGSADDSGGFKTPTTRAPTGRSLLHSAEQIPISAMNDSITSVSKGFAVGFADDTEGDEEDVSVMPKLHG